MLTAIKSAIYTELNSIFDQGKVFYNYAPDNITGLRIIYDIVSMNDNDTLLSDRLSCVIQVAIYYPSKAQQQITSKEADECLKQAYKVLKLKNISHTYEGYTVKSNTLLPELIIPARYDNKNKEWMATVRLRAIFDYVDSETIAVTGVTIIPETLELSRYKTSQLTFTIAPANATNKNVIWYSSDESVATVDSNGLVTAIAKPTETCTITVKTVDGEFEDSCALTITEPIEYTGFKTNIEYMGTNHIGSKIQLEYYYEPEEASVIIQYSSTNTGVATVDDNGLVTITGEGQCNILLKDIVTNDEHLVSIVVQISPI